MESGVTERKAPGRAASIVAQTVAEAFRTTAAQRAEQVAIRTREDAFTITWGELLARVDALAGGLAKLGVQRGETVALLLCNRPEFHVCDLAAMMLGATPFSIYNTYSPEQIGYLLADSEARVAICEQRYLQQMLAARAAAPSVQHVIVVDGEAPARRRRGRSRWRTSRGQTLSSTSRRRSRGCGARTC